MAMAMTASVFGGFSPDAIQFMADLAENNDRAWFQPRKADYERLLKEPMEALCVALAERFAARGIPLQSDPKRSPFRIYRDTRFSKDKAPDNYKVRTGADYAALVPTKRAEIKGNAAIERDQEHDGRDRDLQSPPGQPRALLHPGSVLTR
jgi:uncharacterized protein (DUF2461 family)